MCQHGYRGHGWGVAIRHDALVAHGVVGVHHVSLRQLRLGWGVTIGMHHSRPAHLERCTLHQYTLESGRI